MVSGMKREKAFEASMWTKRKGSFGDLSSLKALRPMWSQLSTLVMGEMDVYVDGQASDPNPKAQAANVAQKVYETPV